MRRYRTVDVFTDSPFEGNQLAVVEDSDDLTESQMQSIAAEFGYSETVFVFPADDSRNTAKLRIFTPTTELPFAGHPTIGAAAILATPGSAVRLEENIGVVDVRVEPGAGEAVYAELTAPQMPSAGPSPPPAAALAAVLGLTPDEITTPCRCFSAGVPFVFVEMKQPESLGRINFSMEQWRTHLSRHWAPQVYAFHISRAESGLDIAARMFSPAFGVLEDTGTGAAAVALAGVLAQDASTAGSAVSHYSITQGVELGRVSRLKCTATLHHGEPQEVRVGGHVVPISQGFLAHPELARAESRDPIERIKPAGQHHT